MSRPVAIVLGAVALLLTSAAPLLAGVATPGAVAGPSWAWAVARQASAASPYQPGTQDHRQSNGGVTTITRTTTGVYLVKFGGLGQSASTNGGNPFVTAMDTTGRTCGQEGWDTDGTDYNVWVNCFDPTGEPADARFSLNFLLYANASGTAGYVWANQPTAASYTPSGDYRYTSSGLTMTIAKIKRGLWDVVMPGLGASGGSPIVSGNGGSCHPVSWHVSDGEEVIRVRCDALAGGQAPSDYTISWNHRVGMLANETGSVAYVYADQPTTATYVPPLANRYSSAGQAPRVTRVGVGSYSVTLNGIPSSGGMTGGSAQVNAVGDTNQRCNLSSIAKTGGVQKVGVICFRPDGTPVDARFAMSYAA